MSATDVAPTISVPRPQRADARRNFDALLAAGREAFAERGLDASLEDIARRAGVGIGTLYRNFPTRESLIETIYLDEIQALVTVADASLALDPWEGLTSWLDRFVDYLATKRVLIDGLNRESDTLKQCRVVMYAAGRPVLQRAQQAGVARADTDIEDVVRLVLGVAGVEFSSEAQRDRVLNLAIDGLRA